MQIVDCLLLNQLNNAVFVAISAACCRLLYVGVITLSKSELRNSCPHICFDAHGDQG